MEYIYDTNTNLYEVEKIINCKIHKNKKYFLIKWLYYPIKDSTWEPKSNLKNLKYLIDEFESEYPYSIDQDMYNIFCEELKKKDKYKNKNKKFCKKYSEEKKLVGRKRKIEYFSDSELNDFYLDKLKTHLYINTDKKLNNYDNNIKISKNNLIIDLSPSESKIEEINTTNSLEELNMTNIKEKKIYRKLIMPILV